MNRMIACLILTIAFPIAHAESCQADAYQDFQDCDTAMNDARKANDLNAARASNDLSTQGDALAAHSVQIVAKKSMTEWSKAHDTCKTKLDDCKAKCTSPDDAEYLNACQSSIDQAMTLANNQMESGTEYADVTGSNTNFTKSADSKFDDSLIDSEKAAAPEGVQQVGCVARTIAAIGVAAQLATCATTTAPSSSDLANAYGRLRPPLQIVTRPQQTSGGQ
jgi:hypothetical protein